MLYAIALLKNVIVYMMRTLMLQNSKQPAPNSRPAPLSLQEKHARAEKELEKFTRLAAQPNLSPGAAALASAMKRSLQAELVLSQKALDYAQPHPDPEIEKNLALYRLLRLPLPTSPSPASPSTSDETETSAPRTSPPSPNS
jgi:hypothetical protein